MAVKSISSNSSGSGAGKLISCASEEAAGISEDDVSDELSEMFSEEVVAEDCSDDTFEETLEGDISEGALLEMLEVSEILLLIYDGSSEGVQPERVNRQRAKDMQRLCSVFI